MKAATPRGAAKGKKAQSPKPPMKGATKRKLPPPVKKAPAKKAIEPKKPVGKGKDQDTVAKKATQKAKVPKLPSPDQAKAQTVAESDTEKRGRGQPTAYKPEYCALATKFCLLGADDDDLARMFDVSVATINNWKLAHPEFLESIKAGKDIADAEVSSKLYHRAKGYSHNAVKIVADAKTGAEHIVPYVEHYPPDTAACIFWLKNRQRAKWRDKVEQEITGKDGGPHEHSVEVVNKTDYTPLMGILSQFANAPAG